MKQLKLRFFTTGSAEITDELAVTCGRNQGYLLGFWLSLPKGKKESLVLFDWGCRVLGFRGEDTNEFNYELSAYRGFFFALYQPQD